MAPPLEIEAKFAVTDLEAVRRALHDRSAPQRLPRLRETNLRFDFADGRLRQAGQVLRLRRNHDLTLTFKAPGPDPEHRFEWQTEVADVEAVGRILEALGLEVVFIYEKYRQAFEFEGCQVMLDEMPFGDFVEVEGPSMEQVRRVSEALGFAWPSRLALTYLGLFQALRERHGYPFRDATFDNFADRPAPVLDDLLAAARPG